jgi:hypothetical protein
MGRQKETCNPAIVDQQLSRWRSIHTLIGSIDFRDLFAQYGSQVVQEWIDLGDLEILRTWVKTIKHGTLTEKTVEELRKLASNNGIRYYGKMSKTELLRALIKTNPNVN